MKASLINLWGIIESRVRQVPTFKNLMKSISQYTTERIQSLQEQRIRRGKHRLRNQPHSSEKESIQLNLWSLKIQCQVKWQPLLRVKTTLESCTVLQWNKQCFLLKIHFSTDRSLTIWIHQAQPLRKSQETWVRLPITTSLASRKTQCSSTSTILTIKLWAQIVKSTNW